MWTSRISAVWGEREAVGSVRDVGLAYVPPSVDIVGILWRYLAILWYCRESLKHNGVEMKSLGPQGKAGAYELSILPICRISSRNPVGADWLQTVPSRCQAVPQFPRWTRRFPMGGPCLRVKTAIVAHRLIVIDFSSWVCVPSF